jgi:DNA-binding XRE family transcriptional regulator
MGERTALIRAREMLGLNRPQFAKRMGGSRNFVHAVEVGRRDPSLAYMRRWVKALGPGASLDLFRIQKRTPYKSRQKPKGEPRRDDVAA